MNLGEGLKLNFSTSRAWWFPTLLHFKVAPGSQPQKNNLILFYDNSDRPSPQQNS